MKRNSNFPYYYFPSILRLFDYHRGKHRKSHFFGFYAKAVTLADGIVGATIGRPALGSCEFAAASGEFVSFYCTDGQCPPLQVAFYRNTCYNTLTKERFFDD